MELAPEQRREMIKPTLGGWLVHVMRSAEGALTLEEALHTIVDSMKLYFPCQSVAIILIDEDTNEMRIKISRQISYTFSKQFRKQGPSATAEKVVLEQRPLLLNNVPRDSEIYRDLKLEHDFTSAVVAPIVKNKRGVGYIFCDRNDSEPFTESDLLHLQVIGLLVGNMMEKFELLQRSRRLSQIDDASQALHYKAFVETFGVELQRSQTHDYPLTLALLAIDAFRKYVEVFGIDAAHALLAEVVSIIRPLIRDMDILARFGADEFVLCLAATGYKEAETKLNAIRAAVRDKAVGQGDAPIELTIGGLVLDTANDKQCGIPDILGAVGRSLVEAKNQKSGRMVIRRKSE